MTLYLRPRCRLEQPGPQQLTGAPASACKTDKVISASSLRAMASLTTCAASTSSSAGSDTSSSLSYSQTSAYGSRFTGSEREDQRQSSHLQVRRHKSLQTEGSPWLHKPNNPSPVPPCRYGATKACRQKDHHGYTNKQPLTSPTCGYGATKACRQKGRGIGMVTHKLLYHSRDQALFFFRLESKKSLIKLFKIKSYRQI
ncbi:uncharacterized protein LOC144875280 isoform X1 [Branchiostoma floridae x Branchiostoma japonicum]